jgi:hypothetical protein
VEFGDVPQGVGWFKPAEHATDVAILVEVLGFDRQRPTPHGPKNSARCNITYFATQADLDAGQPSGVDQGMRVEQTVLARDLESLVGKATINTVVQVPSKTPGSRPAWVWRAVAKSVKDSVVAYAKGREAAAQAAIDAAPGFE